MKLFLHLRLRRTTFSCSSSRYSRVNGCCDSVSRQVVTVEVSISTYNGRIRYCCTRGGNGITKLCLDSLGSHPDPFSYVSLIETLGRTLEADALFQEVVVRFGLGLGLHGSSPLLRLYNALLNGYLRKWSVRVESYGIGKR